MVPAHTGAYPRLAGRLADYRICAVTTAACLILLGGFSKKTFCAVLGCVGGVAAAGIFSGAVGAITPMNGFNMSEAENLLLSAPRRG